MAIQIKARSIEVPASTRDYITKRAAKFDRHIQNITETKVELSEEKTQSKDNRFIVEITLDVQGTFVRGVQRAADIQSAFDIAADTVDRQIRRYKERVQGKKKHIAGLKGELAAEIDEQALEEEEPEGKVIRVKRFAMKPMSPEEAIDQMHLVGHDFYVFFNDSSEQVNVVYRRRQGDYGLIEPELE